MARAKKRGAKLEPSYLHYLPDPLKSDIIRNRCIPVVGAGFSRNAVVPEGASIPLWPELGQSLATALRGPEPQSPLEAISAYQHEFTRGKLVERLGELLLVGSAVPGRTHRAFAQLPFDEVWTTNIEFLLEDAYRDVGRLATPVVQQHQLAVSPADGHVRLVKLHGDLYHAEQLVLTEEDYDGFLERFPVMATYLSHGLMSRTALFLGYSLEDPDFRQIRQVLRNRLGPMTRAAYTILVGASADKVERFERRDVKVVNIPGKPEQYAAIYERLFIELRQFWSDELMKTSTLAGEAPLAELRLPTDAANRLCFVAAPFRLSRFYKTFVYPAVERAGFTPVAAEEIRSPGDSTGAKVSALLDKAELFIIDSGSPNTRQLVSLYTSRRWEPSTEPLVKRSRTRPVLLIHSEEAPPEFDLTGFETIIRPEGVDLSTDVGNISFLEELDQWLNRTFSDLRLRIETEARRLFEKHEYRASVISATATLETELRRILGKDSRLGVSPHELIQEVLNREIMNREEHHQWRRGRTLRIKALHEGETISRPQALEVLLFMESFLTKLKGIAL